MGKHSKVSSSNKWRLGENFVLRLMECWTLELSFDIFMDNHFTFFVYLPTLKLTTFEQHVCSTKIGYVNAPSLRVNNCKKKKWMWPLWTAHIKQKKQCQMTVLGQNNSSAIYIASSESCEPKRCARCWNKVEIFIYIYIYIYIYNQTTKPVPLLQLEHGFYQKYVLIFQGLKN